MRGSPGSSFRDGSEGSRRSVRGHRWRNLAARPGLVAELSIDTSRWNWCWPRWTNYGLPRLCLPGSKIARYLRWQCPINSNDYIYQIPHLMVPAGWYENNFACILKNLNVWHISRLQILYACAVGQTVRRAGRKLSFLSSWDQDPALPASNVSWPTKWTIYITV